jgi:hypothetical protein
LILAAKRTVELLMVQYSEKAGDNVLLFSYVCGAKLDAARVTMDTAAFAEDAAAARARRAPFRKSMAGTLLAAADYR